MLVQELFRRVVSGRSQVVQDMAIYLAPTILREFASIPALGGSGKPSGIHEVEIQELLDSLPVFSNEELQIFSKKGFDQSLATHLINGLFAGMHLIERLPEHKKLLEIEQRVWVLGFTVHDYTKAYSRKVAAGQLPAVRRLVSRLGEMLEFANFMDNWHHYLDDIVFIAQNTQTVQGANLNLRDYHLQLDKHQRETLRMLSSVADLLVHITSPSDVHYRDVRGRDLAYNLRQKLDTLFGFDFAPHLAYHKLLEVRGLLSNLINNATTDALRQQGYEPFLFFPEGVIYLAPRRTQAQVAMADVTKEAWHHVTKLLTGGRQLTEDQDEDDREEGAGLRMKRTQNYIKVPPILYELLDIGTLIESGQKTALAVRKNIAAARLGAELADERKLDTKKLSPKEKENLFTSLGSEWAAQQHLPTDVRVDQLAEYLVFLHHRIFAEFFPKLREATSVLIEMLDLAGEISTERAERQRSGGTPTGWFFVAARYLQTHPELDPDGLEAVMTMLASGSLQFMRERGLTTHNESNTAKIFQEYVEHILEIDGCVTSDHKAGKERFISELLRYMESKEKNNVVCSLCSSPYKAQEQDASIVLFKPQQYSNKSPLDRSRVVRGICPICALEMMLRQVQQGLTAGKAQDQHVAFLYLYPTYFFTTETAQVVQQFAGRLQDLNIARLIFSHLEKQGVHHRNLFTYDDFIIDEEESSGSIVGRRKKPLYSDEDLAALFCIPFLPRRSPGKNLTDTDTWIIPAFFALSLPLLLGVKCVPTTSFTSLFNSASDFQETVRLDGAHAFTKYILGTDRFRVDELPVLVERLLRVYSLHLNVYADDNDFHWGQLTNTAKDLATDPLYVFHYYDRYKRRAEEQQTANKGKRTQQQINHQGNKGISQLEIQRYMGIFYAIGGDSNMGFIGQLVDAYAQFYRAKNLDSAYAVLRPLGTAIDVVVESDPHTDREDLHLLLAGAVHDDLERIRSDQAEGKNPILFRKELDYKSRLELSRQKIGDFASMFLQECFVAYCDSDRAILRERANRIRSAARFHYLSHYNNFS